MQPCAADEASLELEGRPELGRSPDPRFEEKAKPDVAMQSEEGKPRVPLTNRRNRTMKMIASIERLHICARRAAWRMALRAALRR